MIMAPQSKYYQTRPVDRRAWFLILRFIIPVLLVGSGILFLRPILFNYLLLTIYGVLAVALFVYTLSSRIQKETYIRSLIIAVVAGELIIEALLVNHIGGNFSPFVIFFITTIVTASLFFHLLGSIVVATLAGLLYALPIFFDLSILYENLIQPARLAGMGISSDEAFYTVFLHLCLFYFCAFVSGYLAENLFRASRELSKIRLETDEILEQMLSGLMTVDASGRIIYFNKAAGEILGLDHKRAKGKIPAEFFHPGLMEFASRLESTMSSRRPELRAEIIIKHPVRGAVPIGLSSSTLLDDEGRPRGVIAVFQDLTEANRLEAHLRAADRLAVVGRLAAGIAHEIRNPLASISGSVEVLKDDLKLEGDDLRLLELILKESARLNKILTDFLNFARVTRFATGKCNLASIIQEVIALVSTRPGLGDGVCITQSVHRREILLVADEDQLKQVLWNLILNSIEAMGADGGEVRVSTCDYHDTDGPSMVILEVADNGPGIPEEARERIFEPFFSTKNDGTGLGLPIVARIVDCLGGRIELESSSEWKTRFIVYLPIESPNIGKHVMAQEVTAS